MNVHIELTPLGLAFDRLNAAAVALQDATEAINRLWIVAGVPNSGDRYYAASTRTWWEWDGKQLKPSQPPVGWRWDKDEARTVRQQVGEE